MGSDLITLEIVLAVLFLSPIALLVYFAIKGKKLSKILVALGLRGRKFLISKNWREKFRGKELRLYYQGNVFNICVHFRSDVGFELVSKESTDWLDKAYGIVTTGQEDFDQKFVIASNNDRVISEIFQDPRLRELIEKIFVPPVTHIGLDGKELTITLSIESVEDPSALKEVLPSLLELQVLLEELLKIHPVEQEKVSRLSLYLLYVFPLICIVLEIATSIYLEYRAQKGFSPMGFLRPLLTTILLFLPFGTIYVRVAYRITKKHTAPMRNFSISLLILSIWCFSGYPLVETINGYFDTSPPKEEIYYVVGKYEESYLIISKERVAPEGILAKYTMSLRYPLLNVETKDYLRAKPGITMCRVYIRDGLFKIRWVDRYILYEPSSSEKERRRIGYEHYQK